MSASLRDYWDLTKPKVVALIVFTALVGMFLAVPGWPDAGTALVGGIGLLGIWLASSPDVEGVTGRYFQRRHAARSSRASYDVAAQERLWQISEELTATAGLP